MSSLKVQRTQLSQPDNYDPTSRIIFSDVSVGNIPDSKLKFKRVNIFTANPDGTSGELIFRTPRLFSFGLQENRDPVTGRLNGYTLPHCMWDRDGASAEQKQLTDCMECVTEECKKWLIKNREQIEMYDLDMNDLKKFNPFYWKKDKGQIVPGTGPTLYAKLLTNKKDEAIKTKFFDMDRCEIDPLQFLNKRAHIMSLIKFESIFIGTKISLQIKILNVQIDPVETEVAPLLFMGLPSINDVASSDTTPHQQTSSSVSLFPSENDFEEEEISENTPNALNTSVVPNPINTTVPKKTKRGTVAK